VLDKERLSLFAAVLALIAGKLLIRRRFDIPTSAQKLSDSHDCRRSHPTPTENFGPVPTPPRSQVGAIPSNCHLTPVPGTKVFPQGWGGYLVDTTLIGKSPVWAQVPQDLQVGLFPRTQDNPWTGTKILWEVGPDTPVTATVSVRNLATGQLAWWGRGGQPPSEAILTLNAQDEGYHGTPESGWNEWGSELYLLTASCYSMDVSWAGGSWHVVFAAGM